MQALEEEQSRQKASRCPCCDTPIPAPKADAIRSRMEAEAATAQRMYDALVEMQRKLEVRTGRPPKAATAGERISLGLKVTAAIKSRLDQAARETGRTQSQEAEIRIERSFDRQDLLSEVLSLAFGKELAGILMMLGYAMDAAGRHGDLFGRNYDWRHDHHSFGQAVDAAIVLLKAAQPPAKPARRKRNMPPFGIRMARQMTNALCGKGSERSPFRRSDVDAVRALLGPISARMAKANVSPPSSHPVTPKGDSLVAADAVVALINSTPNTPSRQAIAAVLDKARQAPTEMVGL